MPSSAHINTSHAAVVCEWVCVVGRQSGRYRQGAPVGMLVYMKECVLASVSLKTQFHTVFSVTRPGRLRLRGT